MWIFGYGSLVWKADFPYIKKVVGYIKGYERKFYQASIDHRGIPGKPGRVVTLIPSDDPEAKVWGVGYEISDADIKTIDALNCREKRYDRQEILFHPTVCFSNPSKSQPTESSLASSIIIKANSQGERGDLNVGSIQSSLLKETTHVIATTFIGDSNGPLFLGDAPIIEIARQIAEAEGPSGLNRDYLFQLSYFMKSQLPNVIDTHLFSIEKEHRVWGVVYKIHSRDVDYVVKHLDMREVNGYERRNVVFHPISNHPLNIFENDISTSNSTLSASAVNSMNIQISRESSEERDLDCDSGHGSDDSQQSVISDTSTDELDSLSSSDDDEEDFDIKYENVRTGRAFTVTMYYGAENNEHYIGAAPVSQMAAQIFECSGQSGPNREYLFNLAISMRDICDEALDIHLRELDSAVRILEQDETNDGLTQKIFYDNNATSCVAY